MTILARHSAGRILLHLLAMLGNRCVRFHLEGIVRELPSIASALGLLALLRNQAVDALTLYLAQPIKHSIANRDSDPQSIATVLHRGDVLLTQGNSLFAALVTVAAPRSGIPSRRDGANTRPMSSRFAVLQSRR